MVLAAVAELESRSPMLRTFFIKLSENRLVRNLAEESALGNRLSSRFVAGKEVDDVITAAREINDLGMSASLDNLGENVSSPEEARASGELYSELLDRIDAEDVNSNVSLKLTQMGLDLDRSLALEIVEKLATEAAQHSNFVRVDMEGSDYTQQTIDLVREIAAIDGLKPHIGTVIQSYLYRSEDDVRTLCDDGIRIRLCKGAYKEPASIAWQAKSDVDANFVRLMKILLDSGIYHGIATHDEAMISATIGYATERGIEPSSFEFQMLYGVRRDLQKQLIDDGWNMRVYIPFGSDWYPYFMRRLGERPANAIFILKNLFR